MEKIVVQLKETILNQLRPLIDNDYIYVGLPYYVNIGDTLIWEGTKEFLRILPYKCLYSTNDYYFTEHKLEKNIVILLQGGGNFGDLYRQHSLFRRRIIELYPNNKVVILPQSVFYQNEVLLTDDAAFYAKHLNVTICARDNYSYRLLSHHFANQILLVPDMAFYIDLAKYRNLNKAAIRTLYV